MDRNRPNQSISKQLTKRNSLIWWDSFFLGHF
jgi:hypothetical protein